MAYKIEEEYSVLQELLESFKSYNWEVSEKVEERGIKWGEEISGEVFRGKFNHEFNIRQRFNFLEYFLQCTGEDLTLGEKGIEHLWNIYVLSTSAIADSRLFFRWLCRRKGNRPHSLFTPPEALYIFDHLLAPNYNLVGSMGEDFQTCFLSFFYKMNMETGAIKLLKGHILVIHYEELLGLQAIWDLMLECGSSPLSNKSQQVLVDLHLKLDTSLFSCRVEIWLKFIGRCFQIIMSKTGEESPQQRDLIIISILNLLKLFLEQFICAPNPEDMVSYYYSPQTVPVFLQPDNIRYTIQLYYYSTMSYIKKLVAQKIKLHHTDFILKAGGTHIIRIEDTEKVWREAYSTQLTASRLEGVQPLSKEQYPANIISNTPGYINALFGLLSNDKGIYIYIIPIYIIEYSALVWSLLQEKIPENEEIKQEIIEVKVDSNAESEWNKILDSNSIHRFLYSIEIIEQHLHSLEGRQTGGNTRVSNSSAFNQWLTKFSRAGGTNHLFNSLLKFKLDNMENKLIRRCFYIIIKILCKSLGAGGQISIEEFEVRKRDMIVQLLGVLIQQLEYCKQPKLVFGRQGRSHGRYNYYGHGVTGGTDNGLDAEEDEALQQEKRELQRDIFIYRYAFELIYITKPQYYFPTLTTMPEYPNYLFRGLLQCKNYCIREEIRNSLLKMCENIKGEEDSHRIYYIKLFVGFMDKAITQCQATCATYFSLFTQLISSTSRQKLDLAQIQSCDFIMGICTQIKLHPVIERTKSDEDDLLGGLLKLLKSLIIKYPEYKLLLGQDESLIDEILKCLFEFPKCIYNIIYIYN